MNSVALRPKSYTHTSLAILASCSVEYALPANSTVTSTFLEAALVVVAFFVVAAFFVSAFSATALVAVAFLAVVAFLVSLTSA